MLLQVENNYVLMELRDSYLPNFYSEFCKQQQKIISYGLHNNVALKYSSMHLKVTEQNKITKKLIKKP